MTLSTNIKIHYDVVELNDSLTETNDKIEDGEMTDNRSSCVKAQWSERTSLFCIESNFCYTACLLANWRKKKNENENKNKVCNVAAFAVNAPSIKGCELVGNVNGAPRRRAPQCHQIYEVASIKWLHIYPFFHGHGRIEASPSLIYRQT